MTTHWTVSGANYQDDSVYTGPDYSMGWHIFGVDWARDHLTWYIDGVPRKTVANGIEVPNLAMDIQANLDVGGSWIGDPDVTTRWPGQFQIDYIRAWQRSVPQPP
jgi:beta-glucanase (GH16 family)